SLLLIMIGCGPRTEPSSGEVTETSAPPSTQREYVAEPEPQVRFPRRLLFISISNYTTLNKLTAHAPGGTDRSHDIALLLARELKVPTQNDSQLVFLADMAPPPNERFPTRQAIVETVDQFFSSSKPQDRIVIYFGGHVIEIDGKAYLVPIEGDRKDLSLLI